MSKPYKRRLKKSQIKSDYCYFDGRRKVYLTRREAHCFSYLLRGKSAKSTAFILGIAPDTVENYIDMLKKRFGYSSKVELILKANKEGMTDTVMSWIEKNN